MTLLLLVTTLLLQSCSKDEEPKPVKDTTYTVAMNFDFMEHAPEYSDVELTIETLEYDKYDNLVNTIQWHRVLYKDIRIFKAHEKADKFVIRTKFTINYLGLSKTYDRYIWAVTFLTKNQNWDVEITGESKVSDQNPIYNYLGSKSSRCSTDIGLSKNLYNFIYK